MDNFDGSTATALVKLTAATSAILRWSTLRQELTQLKYLRKLMVCWCGTRRSGFCTFKARAAREKAKRHSPKLRRARDDSISKVNEVNAASGSGKRSNTW